MSLLVWTTILTTCAMFGSCLHLSSCSFNSMCLCSSDQHDLDSRSISDVSCISVPFFKLPSTCTLNPPPPSLPPAHLLLRLRYAFVPAPAFSYTLVCFVYMHIARSTSPFGRSGRSSAWRSRYDKRDETYRNGRDATLAAPVENVCVYFSSLP